MQRAGAIAVIERSIVEVFMISDLLSLARLGCDEEAAQILDK